MKKNVLIALAMGCSLLLAACSAPGNSMSAASQPPAAAENSSTSMVDTPAAESNADTSAAGAKSTAYHKITAEEAKKMLDEGGVTVVDVRRADEYAVSHIPGAVLVPVESIGSEPPELLPDKDAVLLVHCRTGVRSKQASDKLVELGYTQIYDFGGIVDWPFETESGA